MEENTPGLIADDEKVTISEDKASSNLLPETMPLLDNVMVNKFL